MVLHSYLYIKVTLLFFCGVALSVSGCGYQKNTNVQSAEFNTTERDKNNNQQSVPNYVSYVDDYEKSLKTGKNYFQISDRYFGENTLSFEEFRKRKDSVDKLYEFHSLLKEKLDYIEVYDQMLQKIGYYDGKADFVLDGNTDLLNEKIVTEDGQENYVTSFNTMQIGQRLNAQLLDVITEGSSFQETDFIYKNNHNIPVVLGDNYRTVYSVGDKFSLSYISEVFDLEVIGFFPKDYGIVRNIASYNLNNFICMPFFEVTDLSNTDLSRDFLFSYYLEKNSCYVGYKAEDKTDKAQKEEIVRKLAKQVGIEFDANEAEYSQFYFPKLPSK